MVHFGCMIGSSGGGVGRVTYGQLNAFLHDFARHIVRYVNWKRLKLINKLFDKMVARRQKYYGYMIWAMQGKRK